MAPCREELSADRAAAAAAALEARLSAPTLTLLEFRGNEEAGFCNGFAAVVREKVVQLLACSEAGSANTYSIVLSPAGLDLLRVVKVRVCGSCNIAAHSCESTAGLCRTLYGRAGLVSPLGLTSSAGRGSDTRRRLHGL